MSHSANIFISCSLTSVLLLSNSVFFHLFSFFFEASLYHIGQYWQIDIQLSQFSYFLNTLQARQNQCLGTTLLPGSTIQ